MKDFIPYEQALELKELGFDEKCLGRFVEHYNQIKWILNSDDFDNWWTENSEDLKVPSPLYQQAFRWFREKYSLHADIGEESDWEENNESWSFDIYKYKLGNNDAMISNCETFNIYEEAELACLNKLIEIVKTK